MRKFLIAAHYSLIDQIDWYWPSFTPQEMACRGTGKVKLFIPFMDGLQRVRDRFGKPMFMTSVYRSPEHNRRVGGSPRSQHVEGKAGDCAIKTVAEGRLLESLAIEQGMTGIGRYAAKKFIHMDMRSGQPARWGHW